MPKKPKELTELLQKAIVDPSGCWIVRGVPMQKGYGRIQRNHIRHLTHRLSWIFHKGDVPEGYLVLHTCDNRACINPLHLYLGTEKDNARDRDIRGRANRRYGENNGNSRLTKTQVLEIRHCARTRGTPTKLAKKFGIHHSSVLDILSGKTWKEVQIGA